LGHPGGNLTGFSLYEFSTGNKWLDLLKQIAPELVRVAVMFNPDASPQSKFFMAAVEAAAPSLGVHAIAAPVLSNADIESAMANLASQPNGGLILPTSAFTAVRYPLIIDLATRYRLPTIGHTGLAKGGGLMDYEANIDVVSQFRQAGTYVDRILKGANPGDLPVQAATHYRFILNLKTAKTLGLTVPLPLLGSADEVIE
jgi:putative ABC transport system substrate-binding protein